MLIYQIPFSEVKDMSALFKNLENSISNSCSIDIENNSLEDAYINIAKEEERLIREMNGPTNNSVSVRQSQVDNELGNAAVEANLLNNLKSDYDTQDLEKYSSVQANPTILV